MTNLRRHRDRAAGEATITPLPGPAGGVQLETFVPWTLVKRGVKKEVIAPPGAPAEFADEARGQRPARDAALDTPLMRALGLAHHWQRLLDEQRVVSVAEIAELEGVDATYVRRLLRLTLMAPSALERLVERLDVALEQVLLRPLPVAWGDQVQALGGPCRSAADRRR